MKMYVAILTILSSYIQIPILNNHDLLWNLFSFRLFHLTYLFNN